MLIWEEASAAFPANLGIEPAASRRLYPLGQNWLLICKMLYT